MDESFYRTLRTMLPSSDAIQRKRWAKYVVENKTNLKALMTKLLMEDKRVASRFLWLLSDIGEVCPVLLKKHIVHLFMLSKDIRDLDFKASFAKYWHLYGIPSEIEGEAIDLLFEWLMSSEVKVNTKARVVYALFKLTKSYPELKNELKSCLEIQRNQNSHNFHKVATKIMDQL
jgi:hypothetical protein